MLAPNIHETNQLLTSVFNETEQIKQFAQACRNTHVGFLEPDPAWLASVRSRLHLLSDAGGAWLEDAPQAVAALLVGFQDYASSVAGLASETVRDPTRQEWIELLDAMLLTDLQRNLAAVTHAQQVIAQHREAFQNIQPLLAQSIEEGWQALADEEREMVAIADRLGQLQQMVVQSAGAVDQDAIAMGKDVFKSTVKMVYSVATSAEASFSFLSMGMAVITVGKFYADIIADTGKVTQELQEIRQLQLEAAADAQAAAGTKMVLQLLYQMELNFARIQDVVPRLQQLWQSQHDLVKYAIDALSAGAQPSDLEALQTLSVANANWSAIDDFATRIANLSFTPAPAVTLDPLHPVVAVRSN